MFKVNIKDTRTRFIFVVLVSLLLTLNIFYTNFYCSYCQCAPPLLCVVGGRGGGGGGVNLLLKGCWERGSNLFRGRGCTFYIKNKLRSEIFNDKKSLYTKMFLSVITKNLTLVILFK